MKKALGVVRIRFFSKSLDIVFAPDVFEAKILLEVPSPIFYPVLISAFLIFGSFRFASDRR
ncbi:hypothetical protein LEP1GSC121_0954 [Leptospira borgpetersenii serovar Castellonis str. 200801910]|uniref:Uncharacterized protein n=1 Tax=Leptospira borgpetersenii serovar Ballum TaxID=280505 RepID=A0A0E3BQN5_LEPBO|nr:hypothetical protein LBBP_00673 [Leptospira borgpetersenii serovar Ballum]EKR02041.1 hypothetical protein LEP1GSC121_0954 [Leptospira borgpetersenii serovar Castellonis str. 200801910]KGE24766.1 hypothetical protein IQ66_06595 [Leptospira borgpetersenii serovar Ballum]OOV43299.1 hypothetical protein B1H38_12640 [Leptospira borgpetersenii serovar Ballum]